MRVAEVIIAEIGVDMSVFASDAHLASWAAVCPGNHSSAGKHYSGRRTHGDVVLLDALTPGRVLWGSLPSCTSLDRTS